MATEVRGIQANLKASGAGKFKAALLGGGRAASKLQQQLAGATAAIGGMGAAMQVATGAFIAFAGAKGAQKAIKAMMELEEQTADLAKLVGEASAVPLRESILDLSNTMPIAREQMMQTAETAARLGIRGAENITKFTTVMSKVGVATDESAGEAAESLARLAKITQTPIQQIDRLASTINKLSNTMATSFSEIDDAAKRAAAGLAPIGASAQEITALTASLVEVSSSARRAGTRLRSFGLQLTDPGKVESIAQAFENVGAEGFKSMLANDPSGTILRMAEIMRAGGRGAAVLNESLTRIGRTVVNQLSINLEGAREAIRRANAEFEAATSLQREYAKRVDTTAARIQVMKNRTDKLAAEIGQNLRPIVLDIVRLLNDWAGALNDIVTTPIEDIVPRQEAEAFREAARRRFGGAESAIARFLRPEGFFGLEIFGRLIPKSVGNVREFEQGVKALANSLDTRLQPAFVQASAEILRQVDSAEEARLQIRQLFLAMRAGSEDVTKTAEALKAFRKMGETSAAEADKLVRRVKRLRQRIPTDTITKFNRVAAEMISNFDPASDKLSGLLDRLEKLRDSLRGNADSLGQATQALREFRRAAAEDIDLDVSIPEFRTRAQKQASRASILGDLIDRLGFTETPPAPQIGAPFRAPPTGGVPFGLLEALEGLRNPQEIGRVLDKFDTSIQAIKEAGFGRLARQLNLLLFNQQELARALNEGELQQGLSDTSRQTNEVGQAITTDLLPALGDLAAELTGTGGKIQKFVQGLSTILQAILRFQQMMAAASAARAAGNMSQAATLSALGPIGLAAGLLSSIASFAGAFQHGGRIGPGQFGIAGEAGPEIVTGPADVTPMEDANVGGGVTFDFSDFPEPKDPRQAARDRQWQRFLAESVDSAKQSGVEF